MKNWQIVFTFDKATFETASVVGATYTEALVNAMMQYPDAEITELLEV